MVNSWLSQELPEANGWTFRPNDGPTCRANFVDIETFYEENIGSFNAAEYRINELSF